MAPESRGFRALWFKVTDFDTSTYTYGSDLLLVKNVCFDVNEFFARTLREFLLVIQKIAHVWAHHQSFKTWPCISVELAFSHLIPFMNEVLEISDSSEAILNNSKSSFCVYKEENMNSSLCLKYLTTLSLYCWMISSFSPYSFFQAYWDSKFLLFIVKLYVCSLPSFTGLTHINSATLPACFVLVLPQPIPVASSTIQKIQALTSECSELTKLYSFFFLSHFVVIFISNSF